MSTVNAPVWDGVPLGAAATLLLERPDLAQVAAGHLRALGARVEVDLTSLRAASELEADLADALAVYWDRCSQLWESLRAQSPSGGYVMVRRCVRDAAQSTTKGSRADLVAELDALSASPALSEIAAELTGTEPDLASLQTMVSPLDGSVTADSGSGTTVTVNLAGAVTLPEALGGVRWPGEVRRTVTLTARHAAWRDRRARRLARVSVEVWEVWPDPLPVQELLPAPVLALSA